MSNEQKKQLVLEISLEIAKRQSLLSYLDYCYYVYQGAWKKGKAVSYLCERVQDFVFKKTGNPYDVLVLSLPPQHGKSMTITETLPSWYLIKHPKKRVICVSYSEDFAQLFGRRNRTKIEEFGELFNLKLAKSPNGATEFETTEGGSMISRGIMSGVTGRACDLMIIDDPVKNRQEADSETYRNRVYDEWENSFKTRLSASAKVIIIQTRWHEDDLAGRIIEFEKNVEVINLPCECESESDPLNRKIGEALCPEIGKDTEWVNAFKASYTTANGLRAWNALFQGRPSMQDGELLKRTWWQLYDIKPDCIETIISCDAAFKDNDNSDFVAIQVWGKINCDCYLLDCIKAHLDFSQTVKTLLTMKAKYPKASRILIEDKANGSAIIQMLRRNISGVIPVNPRGGKVSRVNAVSGAIEAGNVFLPRYESFTAEFINECAVFPNGAHDDQVDCMSQALNRLLYYGAESIVAKSENIFDSFNLKQDLKQEEIIGGDYHVI